MTTAQQKDFAITRIFDAPVDLVWQAWTVSDHVMKWWGPIGFTCPVAKMDVRVGGKSLVCMRAPKEFQGGMDLYSTWTYTRIEPRRLIDYLHHFSDKDGNQIDPATLGLPTDMPQEIRNVITFKDLGNGKTELTCAEYGYVSDQQLELSKLGLEQCLDKMGASFATAVAR